MSDDDADIDASDVTVEGRTDGGASPTPADPDQAADELGDAFAGTVELDDGTTMPVALDEDVVEAAREQGVDLSRLRSAATDVPDDVDFAITADTHRDDTATIPVNDRRDTDLTTNRFESTRFISDPQIQKLQQNSVDYNERIGRFLLEQDDLIPSVKERIKALIVGEEGLEVKPADPDSDADQKLAEHLRDVYQDDVRPDQVIDRIMRENLMNARAVLRATDLAELDLSTLTYLRDGISGEEIYIQSDTSVYEFDIEGDPDDDDAAIDIERVQVDEQPLVIGDQVFDISLYDSPPLRAVADTVVNKMVMQKLKARKAEIASFGAVYAKVNPPSYLPEDQYFERVRDDDWDGDGQPPTKLERALKQNLQKAFDTLKDFQNGTVMSIPAFWDLEQLEVPDQGQPLDEQIRGYNQAIARRMLVPLDLIELKEGAELSRETMFRTLLTTIAGWRREILRIFDQYAEAQKDIHGLTGDVEHKFPPLQDEDPSQVLKALKHAGIAGLSEKEVRELMNSVQGIDLVLDDPDDKDPKQVQPKKGGGGGQQGGQKPPAGGPDDAQARADQMAQFLEEQRRGDQQTAQAADEDDSGVIQMLKQVPGIEDPTNLSREDVARLVLYDASGQLEADSWNPALHPRGPDGKFVERPYDIPDETMSVVNNDEYDAADLLEYAADSPDVGMDVESILSNDDVRIDGVPDDVDTVSGLKTAISEGRTGRGDDGDDTPSFDQPAIPTLDQGGDGHGQVAPRKLDPGYSQQAVQAFQEYVENGDIELPNQDTLNGDGPLGVDKGIAALSADLKASGITTTNANVSSHGSINAIQPYLSMEGVDSAKKDAVASAVNDRLKAAGLDDQYYATFGDSGATGDDSTLRVRRRGESLASIESDFVDDVKAANDGQFSRELAKEYAQGKDLQAEYGFPSNETRAKLDQAMLSSVRDELVTDQADPTDIGGTSDGDTVDLEDVDPQDASLFQRDDDAVTQEAIQPDDIVQMQGPDGDFVAGRVIESPDDLGHDMTVELPNGDRVQSNPQGTFTDYQVTGVLKEGAMDQGDGRDGSGGSDDPLLDAMEPGDDRFESTMSVGGSLREGDVIEYQQKPARKNEKQVGRVQNVDKQMIGPSEVTVQKPDGSTETIEKGTSDASHRVTGVFRPDSDLADIDPKDPEGGRWKDEGVISPEEGDIVRFDGPNGATDMTVGRVVENEGLNSPMTVETADGRRVQVDVGGDVKKGVKRFRGVFKEDKGGPSPDDFVMADDGGKAARLTQRSGSPAERREGVDEGQLGDTPLEPHQIQNEEIPVGALVGKEGYLGGPTAYKVVGYSETRSGKKKMKIAGELGGTQTVYPNDASDYRTYTPRRNANVRIDGWGDDDTPLADRKEAVKQTLDDVLPKFEENEEAHDLSALPIADDDFENAKDKVAGHLARAKDREHAENVIARLQAVGNEKDRASASPNVNRFEEPRTKFQLEEDQSTDTIIHELGHSIGMAYGFAGGSNDQDGSTYPVTQFKWQSPDFETTEKYGIGVPMSERDDEQVQENTSTSYNERTFFQLDDWTDEVDQQVGTGLDGRHFTSAPDDLSADELPEDGMIRLDDTPGFREPQNFEVVDVQTEDLPPDARRMTEAMVTLRGPNGQEHVAEARQRADGLQLNWFDSDFIGYSQVAGTRKSVHDNWKEDPPNADEHLGALDDELSGADAETKMRHLTDRVNKAWYRQAAAAREQPKDRAARYTIKDGYSSKQGHETMSRIHEVMRKEADPDEVADAMQTLVKFHPDLLEAYRQMYDIPTNHKVALNHILEREGHDFRFDVPDSFMDSPGSLPDPTGDAVRRLYEEDGGDA